ncbi:unnamed protein product [Rotaria sp. Silwood2]|nr:unnamed protein product [Rotaria sp. Silwood2]CAF4184139.1 unnamed protein product [Rotaria sp. Silwood2]
MENQLKVYRHSLPVRLYRGQLMTLEELQLLKKSENQLISMNSFLSTTMNHKVASFYLGSPDSESDLQKVLFDIDADPNQDGIRSFADVSNMSEYPDDEEVLMMLGSVFRLNGVNMDDNKIWRLKMSLCSENDCDLKNIFHHMTNQYSLKNTRLTLFASVLIDMANFDDAEKYLRRLLQQMVIHSIDIYKSYHALGKVLFEKGDYKQSLEYYQKTLECCLTKFGINDSRVAYINNSLGEVYHAQSNMKLALESYQTALNIFKRVCKDGDESLAWCYNNLGIIYTEHRNYSKALHYLMKTLDIKRKCLPDGHPCLGNTYNNLGNVYYYLREYDKALNNYQLTCEIFKKSLTSRHPSIARALRSIGIAYEAKEQYTKAKAYYEEAFRIRHAIFSSSHSDLIEINKDIKRVSLNI